MDIFPAWAVWVVIVAAIVVIGGLIVSDVLKKRRDRNDKS